MKRKQIFKHLIATNSKCIWLKVMPEVYYKVCNLRDIVDTAVIEDVRDKINEEIEDNAR